MTVGAAFLGLVPLLWATGTGSDVMKRIAAPIVGGVLTSFLLELVVYPVIYELWKLRSLRQEQVCNSSAPYLKGSGTSRMATRRNL